MRTFVCVSFFQFFVFCFLYACLRVAQKSCTSINLYSVYFQARLTTYYRKDHFSLTLTKKKQSLRLRHNKALLTYIPSARHGKQGSRRFCQPVRQTSSLPGPPTDGSVGHVCFSLASRKHRPHLSSLQAPPVPARASLSKGVMIVYLGTMV